MKKMVFLIGSLGCISLVAMKRPAEEQEIPAVAKAQRDEAEKLQQEPVGFPAEQPRELSQATTEHIAYLKEQAQLGKLTDELLTKILIALAKEKVRGATEEQKLYGAIANIRAFMDAFPQFYGDVQINRDLIQELANRYAHGNVIKVAISLATSGAGQWLKEYVGNDEKKIQKAGFVFVQAAEVGNLGTVRFILHYFPQLINFLDYGGNTALLLAAQNGHISIVNQLLQVPNINVNIQNKPGLTALIYAAANGHVAIIERLLQVPGINVNAQDQQGATALQAAASKGDLAIVNRLLQVPGINVNAQAQRGTTALIWAAENGHLAVVDRLLQAPNINVNMQTPHGNDALTGAIRKDHIEILGRLLKVPDIVAGDRGLRALALAIHSGNSAAVVRLLQEPAIRANINQPYRGRTALELARQSNRPHKDAIIKLLRENGATE